MSHDVGSKAMKAWRLKAGAGALNDLALVDAEKPASSVLFGKVVIHVD
jgi:hypothetical protein